MDLMDHHAFGKYTLIIYCKEKATDLGLKTERHKEDAHGFDIPISSLNSVLQSRCRIQSKLLDSMLDSGVCQFWITVLGLPKSPKPILTKSTTPYATVLPGSSSNTSHFEFPTP